jgi:hypothetical protein
MAAKSAAKRSHVDPAYLITRQVNVVEIHTLAGVEVRLEIPSDMEVTLVERVKWDPERIVHEKPRTTLRVSRKEA